MNPKTRRDPNRSIRLAFRVGFGFYFDSLKSFKSGPTQAQTRPDPTQPVDTPNSNKWRQKVVCLIRHIIMSWYVCVQKVLVLYSFLEFCFINLRIVNCFVDFGNLYFQKLLMGKLRLGCIIYMCSKGISSI